MQPESRSRVAGIAAIIGGLLGVILAPIMVEYLTGWSVIPKPSWIDVVAAALDGLLTFATPVGLWIVYSSLMSFRRNPFERLGHSPNEV